MINFNKNKLINEVLDKYYETFEHTLDTCDYVPEKFNIRISRYIFKNMKKAFRQIDKEDKIYQNNLKLKQKDTKKIKHNRLFFLFHKRSNIVKESAESEQRERIKA